MHFSLGGPFISVCHLNNIGFLHTNHCVVDSSLFHIHSIHYRHIKWYYMLHFASESCGELLCNGRKSWLYQVTVVFQVTVDYCICSIPSGMLHRCLLSKHSQSGEHHSRTHLTIPDEPETSQIPLTNPELVCSPLNLKTQYVQLRSGEARMLSGIPDWVLFLSLVLIMIHLSLPLSCSLLSLLSSINPVSSSPYHTLSYLYTSVLTLTTTPRPFLPGPRLSHYLV